jgi:hypothetical protein
MNYHGGGDGWSSCNEFGVEECDGDGDAVGVFPRFSAYGDWSVLLGLLGHCVGTVNIGSHAPDVPAIYIVLREREPTAINTTCTPVRVRGGVPSLSGFTFPNYRRSYSLHSPP